MKKEVFLPNIKGENPLPFVWRKRIKDNELSEYEFVFKCSKCKQHRRFVVKKGEGVSLVGYKEKDSAKIRSFAKKYFLENKAECPFCGNSNDTEEYSNTNLSFDENGDIKLIRYHVRKKVATHGGFFTSTEKIKIILKSNGHEYVICYKNLKPSRINGSTLETANMMEYYDIVSPNMATSGIYYGENSTAYLKTLNNKQDRELKGKSYLGSFSIDEVLEEIGQEIARRFGTPLLKKLIKDGEIENKEAAIVYLKKKKIPGLPLFALNMILTDSKTYKELYKKQPKNLIQALKIITRGSNVLFRAALKDLIAAHNKKSKANLTLYALVARLFRDEKIRKAAIRSAVLQMICVSREDSKMFAEAEKGLRKLIKAVGEKRVLFELTRKKSHDTLIGHNNTIENYKTMGIFGFISGFSTDEIKKILKKRYWLKGFYCANVYLTSEKNEDLDELLKQYGGVSVGLAKAVELLAETEIMNFNLFYYNSKMYWLETLGIYVIAKGFEEFGTNIYRLDALIFLSGDDYKRFKDTLKKSYKKTNFYVLH